MSTKMIPFEESFRRGAMIRNTSPNNALQGRALTRAAIIRRAGAGALTDIVDA
jgi:hypothetical protein